IGRYVCNTLDEASASQDSAIHSDARPFDFIVIGGGSFGAVAATHLFDIDASHRHRVLVLEAGPLALPEHVQNLPASRSTIPEFSFGSMPRIRKARTCPPTAIQRCSRMSLTMLRGLPPTPGSRSRSTRTPQVSINNSQTTDFINPRNNVVTDAPGL